MGLLKRVADLTAEREMEDLKAKIEKQDADTFYIAVMAGIDMPEEETNEQ